MSHQTPSQTRARAEYARQLAEEQNVWVGKNSWWYADCPKHGTTEHLSVIGGRCSKCQGEALALPQEPDR
jgi:hypothetical protein